MNHERIESVALRDSQNVPCNTISRFPFLLAGPRISASPTKLTRASHAALPCRRKK